MLAAAVMAVLLVPAVQAAGPADAFQAKCAACHGKDGKGQTAMAQKLGVKDLTVTKLSDAEIGDLAKYVAGGMK